MQTKFESGDDLIATRSALRLLSVLLCGFVLLCVLSVFLPHSRYIRYQQFDQSDFFKLRWVYERIHFDPTPIDVAIIGSSRIESALSAPELAASLSQKLGRPIHVVNLGVPWEGPNLHFVVAKELLLSHPETKLILLSVVERENNSHPAFRYVSDASDILLAPLWINHSYAEDAAFLPYRQMSYFVQSLVPSWFGESSRFRGDYFGTDFDTTESFYIPTGKLVDRYHVASPQELAVDVAGREAGLFDANGYWSPPSSWQRLNNPIEPVYVARIAALAKLHRTTLVFMHLPLYASRPGQYGHAAYEQIGPLLDAQKFSDNPHFYADGGHFNRYGTEKISPWLASEIVPYLDSLHSTDVSNRSSSIRRGP